MDLPAERLPGQLRPGERLLWSGAPDPRVWLTPQDAYLIPLTVAAAAFIGFGVVIAVQSDVVFFVVWMGLVALVALYLLAGRFAYKRYRKQRTAYGITSQRALVAGPRTLTDLPLYQRGITVRRSRDGRHASVAFAASAGPSGMFDVYKVGNLSYANTGMELFSRRQLPVAFYDVADPEPMLRALEQARTTSPPRRRPVSGAE